MTAADINQTSNSQQTPNTSPSWASYGVSIMRILKKNLPHNKGTALYDRGNDCVIIRMRCLQFTVYIFKKYDIDYFFPQEAKPALGNTDAWLPLNCCYLLPSSDRDTNIFLISDGHLNNEARTIGSVRNNMLHTRVFALGVGWVFSCCAFFGIFYFIFLYGRP